MYYRGIELKKDDYCRCQRHRAITSYEEDMGYWDVCCNCGKPVEDGFHYYNRYDGEDHDDIDIWE